MAHIFPESPGFGYGHDHGHGHEHDHDHHHHDPASAAAFAAHAKDLKLSADNLSVRYGAKSVIDGISFEVAGGSLVSVVGQNGCGKTTLLKAVAGLVKSQGTIAITERGAALKERSIAYVPQLTTVTSRLTVFEMVLLGLVKDLSLTVDKETFERVDAVLHAMHINRLAGESVASLSGGQKQLVFMAQAFVSNPRILLLDEPTSALDLRHQLIVMQAARDYTDRTGAVTLCVVHDLMAAARYSDRLLMLTDGKIRRFAPPREVLRPELLEEVYRVTAGVAENEGFLTVVPIRPV